MMPAGGKQIAMKIQFSIIFLLVIVFAAAANAERLAISAPVANIRSGPGVSHDILWKVEKYFPILVIEKSGQWYYFQDFEGDKGWVHESLVGKISGVVTNNEACNIRSGPGTDFPILFSVEKGVPFKVLERKDAWIHIEHADGDKARRQSRCLRRGTPAQRHDARAGKAAGDGRADRGCDQSHQAPAGGHREPRDIVA